MKSRLSDLLATGDPVTRTDPATLAIAAIREIAIFGLGLFTGALLMRLLIDTPTR